MTRTIGLVSCTKTKRAEAAPPRELYAPSTLFEKASNFCESEYDSWYILSAKYGLLDPDGPAVEPYNESLTEATKAEREEWGEQVVSEITSELGPLSNIEFVFHAGKAYTEPLSHRLQQEGGAVQSPLAGLMIGERLAWYNNR